MRLLCSVVVAITCLTGIRGTAQITPQLVFGTYLGGRDKECTTAIAVDRFGDALVVGRTPSPDFPVTPRAFSTTTRVNNDDWIGFLSKISPLGDHLVYSSFVGGEFRSSANAVAVDATGRAFVAGSTCSSHFPVSSAALLRKAPGTDKIDACDGFVAWVNADGSRLEYATYLGGKREDSATALALSSDGEVVYVAGYTSSTDFPVTETAIQSHLYGTTNGFVSAFDTRTGRLLYSTYVGGTGNDRITAIAASSDGQLYIAGTTDSRTWPGLSFSLFGSNGRMDGFVVRLDINRSKIVGGIRIGGSDVENLTSIALDKDLNLYIAGSSASDDFPVLGANSAPTGSAFLVKIRAQRLSKGGVVWSRRVGGHGDDALLAVSAELPGRVFAVGRSGSRDFPTSKTAIYPRLEADNDSTLLEFRASDGALLYATFLGGTRQFHASWYNDEATGVVAHPGGDVYVTGCTLDSRLSVTPRAFQLHPKGNSEPFVLKLKFPAKNMGGSPPPK